MVGRSLTLSFTPGMAIGVVYLSVILWCVTGFTPLDLINAIADTIVEPLQGITEAFK